jgi:antitoxin MazE
LQSEIAMQVAKWGNALVVPLPRTVVEELDLKEGDEIEIAVMAKRQLGIARDDRRNEAIERLRALKRPLPENFKYDRDEANKR